MQWCPAQRTEYRLSAGNLRSTTAIALGPSRPDMVVCIILLLKALAAPTALESRYLIPTSEEGVGIPCFIAVEERHILAHSLLQSRRAVLSTWAMIAAVPHSAPVFFAGRIPTCNSEDPLLYFDLLEGGFDKLSRKRSHKLKYWTVRGISSCSRSHIINIFRIRLYM